MTENTGAFRKVYILVMRLRGLHVMAKDCWCHSRVDIIASDKKSETPIIGDLTADYSHCERCGATIQNFDGGKIIVASAALERRIREIVRETLRDLLNRRARGE